MNAWLVFACILLITAVPGMFGMLRGPMLQRLVFLQMMQVLSVLVLLLLAQGFSRDIYFDAALILAVLSFAGSLVFIRFMERWL